VTVPNLVGFDPLKDKRYQQTRLGRDVADFLAWMELGGAAPRTLDQYERDLARACLMFPALALGDFTDAELLHVARSFKPAERRVRVAAYRSFFKWARRTKRIVENPMETLPEMKRPKQKVVDVFTDAEIVALTGLPIRDGALMQVLFDAGLRKGEARMLRLRDFRADRTLDGPHGKLVVLNGKGGKDRIIPASQAIEQKLSELAILDGIGSNDHLWYMTFANDVSSRIVRSRPIGEGTFQRWWKRCLDLAGVRYRNPHVTRHTFATRYLQAGGRLERLTVAMGHASIRTTNDQYAHLTTADIAADLALVEKSGRSS
jgi:integrase/recombinase XerD